MNNKQRQASSEDIRFIMDELGDSLSLVEPSIRKWSEEYVPGHIEHYTEVINQVLVNRTKRNISNILDIGAIPGHISSMLKHLGFNVHAIDINPDRAKAVFTTMNIPYYKVDIEQQPLPFEDSTYDLVLFCEILEHLRFDPIFALQEVHRVLTPGGLLILSTPNITPLMRLRFLLGEDYQGHLPSEFEKLDLIGHMGHFRLYSLNEVHGLLTYVNIVVEQSTTGGKPHKGQNNLGARFLSNILHQSMKSILYVWGVKIE